MRLRQDEPTLFKVQFMVRCMQTENVSYWDMASYTIMPRTDGDGFDIAIVGTNGARQTVLGFKTEAAAAAWIEQDKRLDQSQRKQD